MKLVSKNIEVGTFKVNSIWTKEMADDIKNMKAFDWDAESRMIEEFVRAEKIEKRNKKIDKLLDEK